MPNPLVTGIAPLTVQFTDTSEYNPTSWTWNFGNGQTSSQQTPPPVTYQAGVYDVILTVSNPGGQDTMTKPGYIAVSSDVPDPTAYWSSVYTYASEGASSNGFFEGAIFDSTRSVIATGADDGSSNYLIVAKWNSVGELMWQIQIGTALAYNNLYGQCLVVDSSDNIYVFASGANDTTSIFKLTPSGQVVWQKQIVTKSVGNVISVNDRIMFSRRSLDNNLIITEIDINGILVQDITISTPDLLLGSSNSPRIVHTGNNEFIVTLSKVSNISGQSYDLFVKLNNQMQIMWSQLVNTVVTGNYSGVSVGLAVTSTGDVYRVTSVGTLTKFDSAGSLVKSIRLIPNAGIMSMTCVVYRENFLYIGSYSGHIIKYNTVTDAISYVYRMRIPDGIDGWYMNSPSNAMTVNETNMMYCGYTDRCNGIVVVMPLDLDSYTGLQTVENSLTIIPASYTVEDLIETSVPVVAVSTSSTTNTLTSTNWMIAPAYNVPVTGSLVEYTLADLYVFSNGSTQSQGAWGLLEYMNYQELNGTELVQTNIVDAFAFSFSNAMIAVTSTGDLFVGGSNYRNQLDVTTPAANTYYATTLTSVGTGWSALATQYGADGGIRTAGPIAEKNGILYTWGASNVYDSLVNNLVYTSITPLQFTPEFKFTPTTEGLIAYNGTETWFIGDAKFFTDLGTKNDATYNTNNVWERMVGLPFEPVQVVVNSDNVFTALLLDSLGNVWARQYEQAPLVKILTNVYTIVGALSSVYWGFIDKTGDLWIINPVNPMTISYTDPYSSNFHQLPGKYKWAGFDDWSIGLVAIDLQNYAWWWDWGNSSNSWWGASVSPTDQIVIDGNSPVKKVVLTAGAAFLITGTTPNPFALVTGDPYFANVNLLIHGDGVNGGTNITDSSPLQHTVSISGGIVLSTAQHKFGGSSLYFEGHTANQGYITVDDAIAFNYGQGDFTLEFFYTPGDDNSRFMVITNRDYASPVDVPVEGAFAVTATHDSLTVHDSVQPGGVDISTSGVPVVAGWRHYAVSRSGLTIKLFIDGIAYYSGSHPVNYNNSFPLVVGSWDSGVFGSGYIDELRITYGVARYTANFTPPTAPFPDQ